VITHSLCYPIPLPDPIDAIQYHMQRLGWTRKDLEPFIKRLMLSHDR
jgi:antitoxin component HigA of HigAB toxin-antitoxin module